MHSRLESARSRRLLTALLPCALLTMVGCGGTPAVPAESFSRAEDALATTLAPVADTFVRDGAYATTNYGTATTLDVKDASSGYDRKALLRFDVSHVIGAVRTAKLRLYGQHTVSGTASDSVYAIANNGWTETGVTWNTMPAVGAKLATTATTTTPGYVEWDVTSFVQAQKGAGIGAVSLAVTMDAVETDPDVFQSRESTSNPPQLVVTTSDATADGGAYCSADGGSSGTAQPITCDGGAEYYGHCVSELQVLGQPGYKDYASGVVTGKTQMHGAGVVVDRSSRPNKVYIVDSGHSRILGFNSLGSCGAGATPATSIACTSDVDCAAAPAGNTTCVLSGKSADVIIGQPDASHAQCNGDGNNGMFAPPLHVLSAGTGAQPYTSLCLTNTPRGGNVAEQWMRFNIDVDGQGNLWVPDVYNDRVLRFNAPLSADKAGGKGDAVADLVLGQANFVTNGPNRTPNPTGNAPGAPAANSLDFSDFNGVSPYRDITSRGGVSVDPSGNVWVADTANHRLLGYYASTIAGCMNGPAADIVLGQASMTVSDNTGCENNPPLPSAKNLCFPTLAKYVAQGVSGPELWVMDETGNVAFDARIQVFPVTSTSPKIAVATTASRGITPGFGGVPYTGPVSEGGDPNSDFNTHFATYHFQATGMAVNTYQSGPYAALTNPPSGQTAHGAGVMWVNEHVTNRALLLDLHGNVVDIVGTVDSGPKGMGERGGPSQLICTSSYPWADTLYWPGGALGIDSGDATHPPSLYLTDEQLSVNRVTRYSLPYRGRADQVAGCLPPRKDKTSYSLTGPDAPSPTTLGSAGDGLAVFDNPGGTPSRQLIVHDQNRILVWNDYAKHHDGDAADFILTPPSGAGWSFPADPTRPAIDTKTKRLWTFDDSGRLVAYSLPLVANAAPLYGPLAPSVKNADGTFSTVPNFQSSPFNYSSAKGVTFDPLLARLYVADTNRVLRLDYSQAQSSLLLVDAIFGQVDMTNDCNRVSMPSLTQSNVTVSPAANTLCYVRSVKTSHAGDLYVVENDYEGHGNCRIVVFKHTKLSALGTLPFPNVSADVVFNVNQDGSFTSPPVSFGQNPDDNYFSGASGQGFPFSPITLAFDSQDRAVIGNDGYDGDPNTWHRATHQLYFYDNPLQGLTPTAGEKPVNSIAVPLGSTGDLEYDPDDNLIVHDHTWRRIFILNPAKDPGTWLKPADAPLLP